MSDNVKQLLKLLLGAGLILVEPDKREKVASKVKDRVEDWTDVARDKYEDVVDRLDRVTGAVRGRERVAPNETRSDISASRAAAWANIRFPTLEQAIRSRRAQISTRIHNGRRN